MREKTLLGIIGSPRKLGNSELFVKELYGQLPGKWTLRLIRLTELDIRPCTGCYRCLFVEMKCKLPDDFNLALGALAGADACVVAAPAYVLGANASLKLFQDRALSFNGRLDSLWGKPAVGVAIAGIEGMEGHAKLAVDSFIKVGKMDHRGSEVLYGALPGEIFENGGRELAKKLARQLIEGKASEGCAPTAPSCPTCGGDTFRFLPEGGVRCMICSSAGLLDWRDKELQIVTKPGEHQFFISYERAKDHAEWLRSKKETFLAKRDVLKRITMAYAEIGEWVRPERLEMNENGKSPGEGDAS
jgi:multimeric flavodoxin WrbA